MQYWLRMWWHFGHCTVLYVYDDYISYHSSGVIVWKSDSVSCGRGTCTIRVCFSPTSSTSLCFFKFILCFSFVSKLGPFCVCYVLPLCVGFLLVLHVPPNSQTNVGQMQRKLHITLRQQCLCACWVFILSVIHPCGNINGIFCQFSTSSVSSALCGMNVCRRRPPPTVVNSWSSVVICLRQVSQVALNPFTIKVVDRGSMDNTVMLARIQYNVIVFECVLSKMTKKIFRTRTLCTWEQRVIE